MQFVYIFHISSASFYLPEKQYRLQYNKVEQGMTKIWKFDIFDIPG